MPLNSVIRLSVLLCLSVLKFEGWHECEALSFFRPGYGVEGSPPTPRASAPPENCGCQKVAGVLYKGNSLPLKDVNCPRQGGEYQVLSKGVKNKMSDRAKITGDTGLDPHGALN